MSRTAARIGRAFDAVGVRGWLHVLDIDDEHRAVDVDGHARVPLASTFKVLVALTLERAIDAGSVDPATTIRVGKRRTAGSTGLAAMRDPARLSLRDLAYLMMAVSDNAACDALYDHLGEDAIHATIADLGLGATDIRGPARSMVESLRTDLGVSDDSAVRAKLAEPGAADRLAVLDPDRTSASTPRELARLLAAVWRDEAASPRGCAEVRRLMGLQVWPHRLAAGFPADDIAIYGKTGTMPGLRMEIGVAELPDGHRYAAAVVTQGSPGVANLPPADAVVGQVARMAVDALRAEQAG